MQVCLPRGQAACCAHAPFLKRDQKYMTCSWLRQNPSHKRRPRRSSGYLVTAGLQLEAHTRFSRVQEEFAKAGVSDADSKKVLKQCKEYLQWDCESKLQPALQLWLQELGSEKLREVLQYAPYLLECNPADCGDVFMRLLLPISHGTPAYGVDAALIQRKQPEVMLQKLDDVKRTISIVENTTFFTPLQLRSFKQQHCLALLFSRDHALEILQAVAKALEFPIGSAGMRRTILLAPPQLFGMSAASILQRMSYFCSNYGFQEKRAYDDKWYSHGVPLSREARLRTKALEHGIPLVPEAAMQSRASELQRMLGWQDSELKEAVRNCPALLTYSSAAMAQNIVKLRERHQSRTKLGLTKGCFEVKADSMFSIRELLSITD